MLTELAAEVTAAKRPLLRVDMMWNDMLLKEVKPGEDEKKEVEILGTETGQGKKW